MTQASIKERVAALNPQNAQLKSCSEILLFVADLNRTSVVCQENNAPYVVTDNHDALITATTDASLACQNAAIASESLGYGTVIVGGIRRNSLQLIELCSLPDYCLPLFVLCIGKATDTPDVKPRLPEEVSVFENSYPEINYSKIREYDATLKAYRDTGVESPWTQKFINYFSSNRLAVTTTALKKQKFIS